MGAVFRFICLAGSESNLFGMGKTSFPMAWVTRGVPSLKLQGLPASLADRLQDAVL